MSQNTTIYDLSRGAPPLATVPWEYITGEKKEVKGIDAVIKENLKTLLYKGSEVGGSNFGGYGPLREFYADQHGVTPEQIIIRNGGMDVMTHVLVYLLQQRAESNNPQEEIVVATEVPTYDRFPTNLHNHGIGWAGVPITAAGLDMERLRDVVKKPEVKVFYGIYEAQNPSSFVYTDAQMREVETICAEHNVLVLWDGAYHRLTYGRAPRAFPEVTENVILQYNYTKEISAGLKCGYLVTPKQLVKPLESIVFNSGLNPNYPTQAWIHQFIMTPYYEEHVESLRQMFAPRAQAVQSALTKYSPDAAFNSAIDSGYFIEVDYPGIPDREQFNQALKEERVVISDSTASYHPEFRAESIGKVRIPFATLPPEELLIVCERIANAHTKTRG